jgi:hypothetical protein
LLEWLLGALVLISLLNAVRFLHAHGLLPQPFFPNYWDTWMDGINTAMWAHLPGAYDVWRSIYPPLSFVWLKIFSLSQCYADADGFSIRDCDWVFRYTMWGFFFLNLPLIYLMYRRTDGRTAVPRAIAVGLGLPMLFALERGNLVIPCFTFFAPFLRSARLKWLCVAMTVNFKPYLIGPVFASLLRRRWRWFEGCVVSIILVYAVSYVLYGSGSPMEVIENMIIFAESGREADWSVSYYASSYVSLTVLGRSSSGAGPCRGSSTSGRPWWCSPGSRPCFSRVRSPAIGWLRLPLSLLFAARKPAATRRSLPCSSSFSSAGKARCGSSRSQAPICFA